VLRLGAPPADRVKHERWLKAVSTVAAYRERWNIADDRRPLGPGGAPNLPSQRRSDSRPRTANIPARGSVPCPQNRCESCRPGSSCEQTCDTRTVGHDSGDFTACSAHRESRAHPGVTARRVESLLG
jgi:hypothetical protein